MTDRELIRKVHNGSKEALNQIIEKYYDDIYRFCVYLTGQQTDSYDITQEVFLRFIRYADSYEYKNLKGYLLIIARNLSRDYFRQNRETASIEEIDTLKINSLQCQDAELAKTENKLALTELLQTLPLEQREVIILKTYSGLKFKEIAGVLNCNISTIKSRFRLGIHHLRKEIENAGF